MPKKFKVTEPIQSEMTLPHVKSRLSLFNASTLVPIGVCSLYLGVHFIADFGAYDAMGSQWLYLVIIDLLVIVYILAKNNNYNIATGRVVKNTFSKLYLAFFVLAGLSTFTAINPTEAWVCYVRIIATIIAYFNISILLYGRSDLFKWLAQILGLLLLVESCQTLSQYFNGISSNISSVELILSLKGTTGNKNIFAADLVVKIPFVIYCIQTSKVWSRVFNMLILLLSIITLFIVSARASYLSLFLISFVYFTYCIVNHLKERKMEQTLYRISYILIPLIAAFFISQIVITNAKSLQEEKGYGSVTERLSSVTNINTEDNQVRIRLWAHAIDYTKHHPFIGCGIGNWKIACIPYQRTITNDLIVPVHAHNDFVETFAELGIPGGLLYVGLFGCILIFTIKVYRSNADEETKFVSIFSFMAFIGYSIDAFFNFPNERPISQMFFALITALNVSAFMKAQENKSTQPTASFQSIFGLTAMLFLMPACYVTYLTYKSLVAQRTIIPDLDNEPLKLAWSDIFPLIPAIPDLSATGQPMDAIKGRYLYEAGKYEEALVLLNKGAKANPAIGYSEFLKAGLFFRLGKMDSSYNNGIKAFYTRPKAKTYYQTLLAICSKIKDTASIINAFNEIRRYRNESFAWNLYLTAMLNALELHSNARLLAMSDSALILFPNDKNLLQRKQEVLITLPNAATGKPVQPDALAEANRYYSAGVAAFSKGDYATAAQNFVKSSQLNVANYAVFENAAICYFNLKAYTKAIVYFDKVIALKSSLDGKTEFFKALCLINLGRKADGCALLLLSKSKGYAGAEAIINSHCK